MRILVTNDDGLNAPGLEVLESIAHQLSKEVWVVVPEVEQSGAGHSITLHTPVRVRELGKKRYAVTGTPTDCVLLAARAILPENKKFDLVLSGVNRGWNVAEDITYSGTIAAAMEGTLLGIPSIAMSQAFADGKPVPWEMAATHGVEVVQKIMNAGIPEGVLMNVNFPDVPLDKMLGLRACPQGSRKIGGRLTERVDPRGRPYFWIHVYNRERNTLDHTDLASLFDGYITVTPINLDMTDYMLMETLQAKLTSARDK